MIARRAVPGRGPGPSPVSTETGDSQNVSDVHDVGPVSCDCPRWTRFSGGEGACSVRIVRGYSIPRLVRT